MTAPTIRELLRARYPMITHALVFEVRNAAGFDATRSCDAMVMGTSPSRGLLLSGFEIKANRGDWKHELKRPEKAEAFIPYCDEWYIVEDGKGIVLPDEVPPLWGHLQRQGGRLVCVKKAPRLTPQSLPRTLLATLLKRAHEEAPKATEEAYQRGLAEGRKSGAKWAASRADMDGRHASETLQALQQTIATFQAASGVQIERWSAGKVGAAVRLVLDGGLLQMQAALPRVQAQLRDMLQRLEATEKELAHATTSG